MSDANAIFQEVIQQDRGICGNCFRRTHGHYERNYKLETVQQEDDDGKLRWTKVPVKVSGVEITWPNGETETVGGVEDDVYKHPDNTTKVPEKGALRGLRTVCECGFRWAPEHEIEEWKERPLAKKKFFEYADNLVERCNEAGVTIDEDALYEYLDAKKSDPNEQFADDRLYAHAIHHASTVSAVKE